MADDVLRTRRMRRAEYCFLCARSVFSVSAAVNLLSFPYTHLFTCRHEKAQSGMEKHRIKKHT